MPSKLLLLLALLTSTACAATSESGLLPEIDPQMPTVTASVPVVPASPSSPISPPQPDMSIDAAVNPKSWVDSLPISLDVPFELAAFPATKDLSKQWWDTDKLRVSFARGVKLEPSGVAQLQWRKLPTGERGAVLRGSVKLGKGEVQILQAVVIFKAASRWRLASSAMWVRFRDENGKYADLAKPREQRGLWRADLEDTHNLLIAGWTETALNAARSHLGEYVNDEQLRLALKTCGEVVFRITPKPQPKKI